MTLFRQSLLWTMLASMAISSAWAGERTWYRPRLMQPATEAVPPQPAAAPQKYLILQPTQSAVGQGLHPSPYAYGWFGVSPRSNYDFSRGYYNQVQIWHGK
jgi:hypothetical protein